MFHVFNQVRNRGINSHRDKELETKIKGRKKAKAKRKTENLP